MLSTAAPALPNYGNTSLRRLHDAAPFLRIPHNERTFIGGKTRSGKTVLSRLMCYDKRYLLVVDPKHCVKLFQPSIIAYTHEDLQRAAEIAYNEEIRTAVVYRPPVEELEDGSVDMAYRWAFYTGNIYVDTDELTAVIKGPQTYPHYLRACMTMGGERNVGMLNVSQRPAYLPKFIYSESENLVKFKLRLKEDNQTMAEWMGPEIMAPHEGPDGRPSKHSFYFNTIDDEAPARQYQLILGGGT